MIFFFNYFLQRHISYLRTGWDMIFVAGTARASNSVPSSASLPVDSSVAAPPNIGAYGRTHRHLISLISLFVAELCPTFRPMYRVSYLVQYRVSAVTFLCDVVISSHVGISSGQAFCGGGGKQKIRITTTEKKIKTKCTSNQTH